MSDECFICFQSGTNNEPTIDLNQRIIHQTPNGQLRPTESVQPTGSVRRTESVRQMFPMLPFLPFLQFLQLSPSWSSELEVEETELTQFGIAQTEDTQDTPDTPDTQDPEIGVETEVPQHQMCRASVHQSCLDIWLREHHNCPICRSSVLVRGIGPLVGSGDDPTNEYFDCLHCLLCIVCMIGVALIVRFL